MPVMKFRRDDQPAQRTVRHADVGVHQPALAMPDTATNTPMADGLEVERDQRSQRRQAQQEQIDRVKAEARPASPCPRRNGARRESATATAPCAAAGGSRRRPRSPRASAKRDLKRPAISRAIHCRSDGAQIDAAAVDAAEREQQRQVEQQPVHEPRERVHGPSRPEGRAGSGCRLASRSNGMKTAAAISSARTGSRISEADIEGSGAKARPPRAASGARGIDPRVRGVPATDNSCRARTANGSARLTRAAMSELPRGPAGPYCAACGQRRDRSAATCPSRRFVSELADEVGTLGFRFKTVRTLRSLLIPGLLTAEFLAGRRQPYLSPMKVYFVCAAIFFLAAPLAGFTLPSLIADDRSGELLRLVAARAAARGIDPAMLQSAVRPAPAVGLHARARFRRDRGRRAAAAVVSPTACRSARTWCSRCTTSRSCIW